MSETREEEAELLALDADGVGEGRAGRARFRLESVEWRLVDDELAELVLRDNIQCK